MKPIKVLVVDDSPLMRRLVSRLLEATGDIKVVDTAANGEEAVKKICALRPDVVSLDLEMPVLDGLGVLRRVMRECPVPVVMLSAHTTEGAQATIKALSLGAVDFVPKPAGPGNLDTMIAELLLKLKTASQVSLNKLSFLPQVPGSSSSPDVSFSAGSRTSGEGTRKPSHRSRLSLASMGSDIDRRVANTKYTGAAHACADEGMLRSSGGIELVVIGCSTGGPAALQALIPALPGDFSAAVVVVQHLPSGFSKSLAEHLDRRAKLQVRHAESGDPVVPGQVLVAPAGYEFSFRRRSGNVTVVVNSGSIPLPPGGFRPSVDGVMISAAETYGNRVMGVVLTGMGQDGARGLATIRKRGGYTLVEDESTCVVYGMPRAAIEAGAAERVVPLGEMAGEIIKLICKG